MSTTESDIWTRLRSREGGAVPPPVVPPAPVSVWAALKNRPERIPAATPKPILTRSADPEPDPRETTGRVRTGLSALGAGIQAAKQRLLDKYVEIAKSESVRQQLRGLAESGYATSIGVGTLAAGALDAIGADGLAERERRIVEQRRQGREGAREFFGDPETTGGKIAQFGGRAVGDVVQFMLPGGAVEKLAPLAAGTRAARLLAPATTVGKIARDAAIAAPLDVAMSAGGPEESVAGAVADLTGNETARKIAENPVTRALAEVATGVGGDLAVRGAVGAVRSGARAVKAVTPEAIKPARVRERIADAIDPSRKAEVARLRDERRAAERAAETDELTGVANRKAFDKARASAEADPETSIAVFDVAGLKAANDIVGADKGDEVIRRASDSIKQAANEAVGTGERVFRHGGDELAWIGPKDKADQVLARAKELMGEEDVGPYKVTLRGAVGDTFEQADEGVRAAKASEVGPKYRKIETGVEDVPGTTIADEAPTRAPESEVALEPGVSFAPESLSPARTRLVAMKDGEEVGYVKYAIQGTKDDAGIHIEEVFVDPKLRRRGIATSLYENIRASHPGMKWFNGGQHTMQGDEFRAAWNRRVEARAPREAVPSVRTPEPEVATPVREVPKARLSEMEDIARSTEQSMSRNSVFSSIQTDRQGVVAGSKTNFDDRIEQAIAGDQSRADGLRELYEANEPLREYIRERVGPTITLYRNEFTDESHRVAGKPTTYYANKRFAESFGAPPDRVLVSKEVPVEEIIHAGPASAGDGIEYLVSNDFERLRPVLDRRAASGAREGKAVERPIPELTGPGGRVFNAVEADNAIAGISPEGQARLTRAEKLRRVVMEQRNEAESTALDARREFQGARKEMRTVADNIRAAERTIRLEEIRLARLRERQRHVPLQPPTRRPRASVSDDAIGTDEQISELRRSDELAEIDRSADGPVELRGDQLVTVGTPASRPRPAGAPLGAEEARVIEEIGKSERALSEARSSLPELRAEYRRLRSVVRNVQKKLQPAEARAQELAGDLPPGARRPVVEPEPDAPQASPEAHAALDAAVDFANAGPKRLTSSRTTTRAQHISDVQGNAYGPIRRLGQLVKENLPPTRNPEHLLEAAQNSNFIAHEAISGKGIPDPRDPSRTLGPSLAYVFEPLGRDPERVREGIKYALAERIEARGATAIAKNLEQFENWKAIAAEGRGVRERVEFVNRIDSYMTGLKEYARIRGLWDDEFIQALDLSDLVYLPLNRVMENIEVSRGIRSMPGSGSLGVHRLHGSARITQNPVNSLLVLTEAIVKRADEHMLMKSITDSIESLGAEGQEIATKVVRERGVKSAQEARARSVKRLEAAGWELTEGQARLLGELEEVTGVADARNPVVKVRNDAGVIDEWLFHDPFLWSSIESLRPREQGALGEFFHTVLTGPAKRIFQATHTGLNLTFSVGTGPIRDLFSARYLKGKGKWGPIDYGVAFGANILDQYGVGKAEYLASILRQHGMEDRAITKVVDKAVNEAAFVRELRRAGMGSVSFLAHYDRVGRAARSIAPATRTQKVLHHLEESTQGLLEKIEALGMAFDATPRVAEAKAIRAAAIKAGEDPREALQRAVTSGNNVTVNYRDRPASEVLSALGVHIPFFNVALSSTNRFGRAMASDPKRGAIYASGAAMAATLAWGMQAINGTLAAEQDNHPRYRARELVFPLVGADQDHSRGRITVRIPIDPETALFTGAVTAALNKVWGDDPNAGAVMLESIFNVLPPGMAEWAQGEAAIPLPVIQQMQENWRNKRFFDDAPIESQSLRSRSKTERRRESTPVTYTGLSRLADGLGVEMSPLEIRNIVKSGALGGFEPAVTHLTDPLTEALLPDDRTPRAIKGQERSPFDPLSAFVANRPASGVFVDQFYDLRERQSQLKADYRAAAKSGDKGAARAALADEDAYLASDQGETLLNAGTSAQKQAREARDKVSVALRDKAITEEEANQALNRITVIENRVMRDIVVQIHALRRREQ